jgi:adenine-specific DNA-methyltransferase
LADDLAFVRSLRREQTEAEALLWSRLRNRALGPKFRPQFRIGPYVVDFWCVEARLAIELDGAHHLEPGPHACDAERTAFLEERGARVVRFLDTEVLRETTQVVQRISDLLVAHDDRRPDVTHQRRSEA